MISHGVLGSISDILCSGVQTLASTYILSFKFSLVFRANKGFSTYTCRRPIHNVIRHIWKCESHMKEMDDKADMPAEICTMSCRTWNLWLHWWTCYWDILTLGPSPDDSAPEPADGDKPPSSSTSCILWRLWTNSQPEKDSQRKKSLRNLKYYLRIL